MFGFSKNDSIPTSVDNTLNLNKEKTPQSSHLNF